ncbi:MAG: GatB/YqeY domain-containing protein [Patescibacteria group bacterium]
MYEKIQNQIRDAMRAKDAVRLITLRSMLATFVNELISKGRKPSEELEEKDMIVVIRRLVKQRNDSIEQFQKGGREDLVLNERAELAILNEFLPSQMSEEQIRAIVLKKKKEMDITDKAKIGVLVGAVIKETKGEADGSVVKKIVEEILA